MKRNALACALVVLICTAAYGQIEIPWFAVDSGGAEVCAGGSYALRGSMGQAGAASEVPLTGGSFTLTGGFFAAESAEGSGLAGDLDGDGDVDLLDFATFAVCITSSGGTTRPDQCAEEAFEAADLDGDGDVDLIDFASFAAVFTG